MIFRETEIAGVFVIEPERQEDSRGFFARIWCREEFARHGIGKPLDQCSVSFNRERGTLRGLHYQADSHPESKLVRCTQGRVFDVAADIRPGSPTWGRWIGVELSAANHKTVYVPEGCAHGFQTLEADCEVFYQMSGPFRPEAARGVRWDDPTLGVAWPLGEPVMSERDRTLSLLGDKPSLSGALSCS